MLICVVECLGGLKSSSGPLGLIPKVRDGRKERLGGWSVCWIREAGFLKSTGWMWWSLGGTVNGSYG